MATFGPPFVNTANLADGSVTSAKIALDTIAAVDVATNAIGDSEIAAHTTTKITVPTSLVSGTLPLNQGGTGQTTLTPAFDALAPTTTQGDIIYHNGTDNVRLGPGTSGQFLKTQGAGANPIWAGASGTFTNGTASKTITDATTTQNLAHGLGVVPKKVKITVIRDSNNGGFNFFSYNGTTSSNIFFDGITGSNSTTGTTIKLLSDAAAGFQTGTVTFDATNISISWVKTDSGAMAGTGYILWEAFS